MRAQYIGALVLLTSLACRDNDGGGHHPQALAKRFIQPCGAMAKVGEGEHLDAEPSASDLGSVLATDLQGRLLFSQDAGRSWAPAIPDGQCHLPVRWIASGSSYSQTICVKTRGPEEIDGLVFCSQDKAASWSQLKRPDILLEQRGVSLPHIDRSNPKRLYASFWASPLGYTAPENGAPGYVLPVITFGFTEDMGATWIMNRELDERYLWLEYAEGSVFVIRLDDGFDNVYKCSQSLDCHGVFEGEALVWLRDRTRGTCAHVNSFDASQIMVAYGESTKISKDGGKTLLETTGDMCSENFAFVDKKGSMMAWNNDDGSVLRTKDWAQSWQTVAPFPEAQCRLQSDGAETLFCIGKQSVYRSDDGADSWHKIDLSVRAIEFDI